MRNHVKSARMRTLPESIRLELIAERRKRKWTQAELGARLGLPQMHISGIETGKIVPRFDTLLDLVRVLDQDLLLVPRALVPAVQAMVREHMNPGAGNTEDESPLYATEDADAS